MLMIANRRNYTNRICGSVVEYIVAIDVTRVRFPADAFFGDGAARAVPGTEPGPRAP